MAFRYTPGPWRAVVTPSGVAMLPDTVPTAVLDAVWSALDAGDGLAAVLESLTAAFGTSLSAIPPFAVATLAPASAAAASVGAAVAPSASSLAGTPPPRVGVRLAVRGPLTLTVTEPGAAPYDVSGAEVTTWNERSVPAATHLLLTTPAAPAHTPTPANTPNPVADGGASAAQRADTASIPSDGPELRRSEPEWFGIGSGVVLCSAVALDLTDAAAAPSSPASVPAPAAGSAPGPAPAPTAATIPDPTPVPRSETEVPEATIVPNAAEAEPARLAAVEAEHPPVSTSATAHDEPATGSESESEAAASGTTTTTEAAGPEVSPAAADTDAGAADAEIESGATDAEPDVTAAEDEAADGLDDEIAHTRTELPDDAYDHLWGATVVKSVEEAAVRDLDDEAEEEEAAPSGARTAPASADSSEAQPATADGIGASTTAAPAGFAPPTAPAAGPATPPPASPGLIDSVPGFSAVGASSGSAGFDAHTVPPTPGSDSGPAGSPAAFGASSTNAGTRTGTGAESDTGALGPGTSGAGGSGDLSTPGGDDDHDGLTITVSELEALRRLDAAAGEPTPALPDSALGRIVLSTGESHPLDRPIIIGRRPRANRVQADQVPVLVTVASPEQDISRNHLEVRLEGRHVLAVDLATTNGSILHREGTPPLRLTPSEPVLVLSGDIVDIGDDVTVTFEEIP